MTTFNPLRWRIAVLAALIVLALASSAAHAQKPNANKYPFAVPPLEIYGQAVKEKLAPVDSITMADRKLLADFWAARTGKAAKDVPQADDAAVLLHLLASGVTDPKARAEYLKKFNVLVDDAKKATADAESDREKADHLLRFLHKGPMAGKYEAKETTLSALFDTGKFNCVSSSCLYFLVGTRLGLTLQPILIHGNGFSAGHAAVDLIDDGKRIEIEPTNADGFDWATKIKQPGVFVLGGASDRKKAYDADGFSLAASIASNRAVDVAAPDAIACLVVALVLAPTDPAVANNTAAVVVNWGLKHYRDAKYEDALTVYAFGRAALGAAGKLENNYHAVWAQYLDDVVCAGQFEVGLKLLPRAAAAFPKDKAFTQPAEWVSRAAHHKADKNGWAAGLALADKALEVLSGDDAKAVRAWKGYARRLWSQAHLRKGEVNDSLTVLTDGLAESPGDKELLAGLTVHTQESLRFLDAKKGTDAAIVHFEALRKLFPKNKDISERGFHHAHRTMEAVCKRKKFADAMTAADTYGPLAGDRVTELKSFVFDLWAQSLADEGKWEEALAKYMEGLEADPKNRDLNHNAIVLIDDWASKSIDKKDWAAAIAVYELGLKHFPDNGHLKNNRAYCKEQQMK